MIGIAEGRGAANLGGRRSRASALPWPPRFSALPLVLPLVVAALPALAQRQESRPRVCAVWRSRSSARSRPSPSASRTRCSRPEPSSTTSSSRARWSGTPGCSPTPTSTSASRRSSTTSASWCCGGWGRCSAWPRWSGRSGALRAKGRKIPAADWILLAWVVPFFAVTVSFDVKFLRYLLPIYPMLVLWAAAWLQGWAERSRAGRWARGTVVAGTALYLLAFLAIYTRPHTTVTASEWFYSHVPRRARRSSPRTGTRASRFRLPGRSPETLPGLRPSRSTTRTRRQRSRAWPARLASSDYLVLQTKRLYGAITRVPAQVPAHEQLLPRAVRRRPRLRPRQGRRLAARAARGRAADGAGRRVVLGLRPPQGR